MTQIQETLDASEQQLSDGDRCSLSSDTASPTSVLSFANVATDVDATDVEPAVDIGYSVSEFSLIGTLRPSAMACRLLANFWPSRPIGGRILGGRPYTSRRSWHQVL